ncbi:hypothetical protein FRB97_000727, partial [Tulasnella sp. 331]
DRDKRVLYFPFVMIPPAAAGCIALVMFDILAHKSTPEPGFPAQYYAVSVTLFTLTITMTWYSTGIICYRLWSMERQNRAATEANGIGSASSALNAGLYRYLFRVMIQSGLLYSLTQLSYLICFIAKDVSGQFVISLLNVRIIGIVTALIMLQLHLFNDGTNFDSDDRDHVRPMQGVTTYSIPVFRPMGSAGTRATATSQDEGGMSVEKDVGAEKP